MRLCATRIIVSVLFLLAATTVLLQTVGAQTPSNYAVTVKAETPNVVMYSTIAHNLTLTFRAVWTFGASSGQPVEDANVTVDVETSNGALIDAFNVTTFNVTTGNAGVLSFNYSVPTPEILTFTPTTIFSSDGAKYNSSLLQAENNLYGLKSESISVYYDTFDVALLSSDTSAQGTTKVIVNVTYLLVPEEGLTLPPSSSYLNQTLFPKIAHGVDVTINGVKAQESADFGVYIAEFATFLPTSYVLVEVSKADWSLNQEAFGFTHTSNAGVWLPAVAVAVVCVFLRSGFLLFRKRKDHVVSSFPVIGAITLLGASFMSLYWGVVGVDSTLHGFSWILLASVGVASFIFGVAGCAMCWKRKRQAAVLFVICLSLVANVAMVKASLDSYLLPMPWMLLALSFVISIISGLFIGNSDNQFTTKQA